MLNPGFDSCLWLWSIAYILGSSLIILGSIVLFASFLIDCVSNCYTHYFTEKRLRKLLEETVSRYVLNVGAIILNSLRYMITHRQKYDALALRKKGHRSDIEEEEKKKRRGGNKREGV